jgi:hypothetical protein
MMAEFLARQVYEGKITFVEVPQRFKPRVRTILKEKYDIDV